MTDHMDPDSPIAHEAAADAHEILSGGLLLQVDRILEGSIFNAWKRMGAIVDPVERAEYFICLIGSMVKVSVHAAELKDHGIFGSTLADALTRAQEERWTF